MFAGNLGAFYQLPQGAHNLLVLVRWHSLSVSPCAIGLGALYGFNVMQVSVGGLVWLRWLLEQIQARNLVFRYTL